MKKGALDRQESYGESVKILKRAISEYGFQASSLCEDNYCRIWGRDSMVCSLAALVSDDKELRLTVKASLKTLLEHQYKHGQIPSNVDVKNKKVSFGGTAGRVDATLWFLIVFSQYIKRTNDIKFLKKYYSKFKKAAELVHLYEFNDKHFIYVPMGGDWADEYLQEGYVLYDQLLHFRALKEHIDLRKKLRRKTSELEGRYKIMKKFLKVNYWFDSYKADSPYVYHSALFKKIHKLKAYKKPYMLPYFNPSGYGNHFDGFANSLALHFQCLDEKKERKLRKYVEKQFSKHGLLPAFYPVITPKDPSWDKLKNNYSIKFKNKPYEYHNGGYWAMVTGFYATAISKDKNKALIFLDGINRANYKSKRGNWGFFEFINSKTLRPEGKMYQAWSAAAGIAAYQAILKGKRLFI